MNNTKKMVGFVGLMIVNFIAMFLIAGVGVYSYTIAELFDNIASVGMIFTLECLARSISIPLGGKIGDKIGHKKLFLISLALYTIAYAGVAVSTSFWMFTIARMISGFAWGLFMMNGFVIISAIWGQDKAPKYSGYNQTLTTVALIVAAPITGVFCSFNWRLEFYLGIALLAIGFVMCLYGLPNIAPSAVKGAKVDGAGIALATLFLVAFTFAMNFGGTYGWGSPIILGALAAAAVAAVLLLTVEKKAEDPIVPVKLFKNKYYVCIFMLSLVYCIANGAASYAPTYAQYTLGTDSVIAGLISTPGMIVATVLTTYFGSMAAKTGKYKKMVMIWGVGTLVSGIAWLGLGLTANTTVGFGILFAGCFAISCMNSANSIAPYTYPMTILEPQDLASGLAFMGLAGTFGSTVAGGLCTALMNSPFGLVSVFWLPAVCAAIMMVFCFKFKDVK